MARIRTIKPTFWTHPVLARLSDDTQLLAIALLSMADDSGYFRADPAIVRGEVMPFRESLARISECIEKLSQVGFIEVVRHPEQGDIGRIVKWADHQKVDHARPSKLKVYFVRENVANPREEIALEQGRGKREEGKESASPALLFSDLKPCEAARMYLESEIVSYPVTRFALMDVEAGIKAIQLERKLETKPALDWLLGQAQKAKSSGKEVGPEWIKKAGYNKLTPKKPPPMVNAYDLKMAQLRAEGVEI